MWLFPCRAGRGRKLSGVRNDSWQSLTLAASALRGLLVKWWASHAVLNLRSCSSLPISRWPFPRAEKSTSCGSCGCGAAFLAGDVGVRNVREDIVNIPANAGVCPSVPSPLSLSSGAVPLQPCTAARSKRQACHPARGLLRVPGCS